MAHKVSLVGRHQYVIWVRYLSQKKMRALQTVRRYVFFNVVGLERVQSYHSNLPPLEKKKKG